MSLRESPLLRQGEDVKTATAPDPPRPPGWPPRATSPSFSWLLARDVEQGRAALNFSTWDEDEGEADDAVDVVADGEMPPRRYLLVHPDAALDDAERQVLIQALEAMDRGGDNRGPGGGEDEDP